MYVRAFVCSLSNSWSSACVGLFSLGHNPNVRGRARFCLSVCVNVLVNVYRVHTAVCVSE